MKNMPFDEEWIIVRDLVRIIGSSLTNNGNYKKMNCKNFAKTYCSAWSWTSRPTSNFQIHEPYQKGDSWFINPNPFLCASCPKWVKR